MTHNVYDGHPVPSRVASFEEVDHLIAATMNQSRPGLMQATIGPGFLSDAFARIAGEQGCTITWTALMAGLLGPDSHRRLLETAQEQQSRGLRIVPQVSCRPANFELSFAEPRLFQVLRTFEPVMKADPAGTCALYRDPDFRDAFRGEAALGQKNFVAGWTQRTVIAYVPGAPELAERNLSEAAAEHGVDPIDFALDLALAHDLEPRFRIALANYDEIEVAALLNADGVLLANSDAGAHANQLCDACYSTYLLGHWVREKNVLTLEQAVEMLTRIPAELFGLTDRGRLAGGVPADVVVFDPLTVAAGPLQRVYDLPAGADRLVSEAIGIDAVICNGGLVRRNGEDVSDGKHGRVLRAHASAQA